MFLKVAIVNLLPRLSADPGASGKSTLPIWLPLAKFKSIVATFNDTAKFMSPNVPVPTELPFGSATPQLVAGQNPANACPKDRTHSMPETAKAIAINAARTVGLKKIVRIAVRIACTCSLYPYIYRNATPVNRRNQGRDMKEPQP